MLKTPLLILFILALAVPAFANTHHSVATISPSIVKAGTPYTFTAHITNVTGPDSVSEFRIYLLTNPPDITDINCLPAAGWYGPFVIPGANGDFCQYTAKTTSDYIAPGNSKDFSFTGTSPKTASCRDMNLETRDPNQYYTPLPLKVCVDITPPVTTKTYDPTPYLNGNSEWISTSTWITLNAVDPEPHPAGVDKTLYQDIIVPESWCYNPAENCADYPGDNAVQGTTGGNIIATSPVWNEYNGPFQKAEESCHYLGFYSIDKVGNKENLKWQCFFVDNTKPVLTKTVGTPSQPGDGKTFDYWVSQKTPISLHCADTGPHPSNNVTIHWSYTIDDGEPITGSSNTPDYALYFKEDSVHALDAWCTDAVGNTSLHDIETFKVDGTPPEIKKTMLGVEGKDYLGNCPPQSADQNCYVADNGRGGVHVSVKDPDPTGKGCNVSQSTCTYELLWDATSEKCDAANGEYNPDTQKCLLESGEFGENGTDILFKQDSTHTLVINCKDALGNTMKEDSEKFLVDSTPPVTTKTYGDPHYPLNINDSAKYPHWISTSTPITLNATDAKVGVDKTYWRTFVANDRYCRTEHSGCQNAEAPELGWNEYTGSFTEKEQSCHIIEFYSTDKFGNTETVKRQCVFVDSNPPTVAKTVGEPKIVDGNNTYISQQTPITLSCQDGEPHPVDNVSIQYRYSTSKDCENWGEPTDWINYEAPFTFPQDSCHKLEYKCADGLGNTTQVYSETDIVDSQGPIITKEIIVDHHNGEISVDSKYGEGTTFTIKLNTKT